MANFGPTDYGKIGLSFANWQKYAGMDDKNPFGVDTGSPALPKAMESLAGNQQSYSQFAVPPKPLAPTGFGVAPKTGIGLSTGTSGLSMPNFSLPSLDDEINKYFTPGD